MKYISCADIDENNVLNIEIEKDTHLLEINDIEYMSGLLAPALRECTGINIKLNGNPRYKFENGCLVDINKKALILADPNIEKLPNDLLYIYPCALTPVRLKELHIHSDLQVASGSFCQSHITKVIFHEPFQSANFAGILLRDSSINTIELPSSVNTIEEINKYEYENLTHIIIDKRNKYFSSGDNDDYIIDLRKKALIFTTPRFKEIPDNVQVINGKAIFGLKFETFKIPQNIKKLKSSAFKYCRIDNLIIDASLDEINANIFSKCRIKSLEAPNINPLNIYDTNLRDLAFKSFPRLLDENKLNPTIIDGYKQLINANYEVYEKYLFSDINNAKCFIKNNIINGENIEKAISYVNTNKLNELATLLLKKACSYKNTENANKEIDLSDDKPKSLAVLAENYKYKVDKKGNIKVEKYIGKTRTVRLPENGEFNIVSWNKNTFYKTRALKVIIPGSYKTFNFGFCFKNESFTVIYEEGIEYISADLFYQYAGNEICLPSTLKDIIYDREDDSINYNISSVLGICRSKIRFPNGNDAFKFINRCGDPAYFVDITLLYNNNLKKLYFTKDVNLVPLDCEIFEKDAFILYKKQNIDVSPFKNLKEIYSQNRATFDPNDDHLY